MSDRAARATGAKLAPARPLLLEARGVDKDFYDAGRRIQVLRGLDLEVCRGDRIAVVGQSGVGKSTMLHVLGGLEAPTAGTVSFEGQDLLALDAAAIAEFRNRKLGFVFQFHYLLADFTALENVMMPALIARMSDSEARSRAQAVLEMVGLADKLNRRPTELSGGEQQRVAVARAVALHPSLVLADEPTGNLDPYTADEVHRLFEQLNKELGITLVIATHNERLARRMSRVLRLKEGRLFDEPIV
jgi:lipoprotein-releasing system ATP-binding protein